MYSGKSTRALPRVGFPIRKSRDQRLVSISPGLIAAAHVLHRLLAPRHPPCALILLIEKNTCFCHYGVFKVHAGLGPPKKEPPRGRSLKTQQRGRNTEFDIFLGELATRTAETIDGRVTYRSNRSGIPRKEVIQPQLPLRLPCYDFTPIIDPTFDGSLPCGLGHRLRVLPTFVV
jgi:hypothetical protein